MVMAAAKFVGAAALVLVGIVALQHAVVATRCMWLVNDPLNVLGCG